MPASSSSNCDSPSTFNFVSAPTSSNSFQYLSHVNASGSIAAGNTLYRTYSESSSFSPSTVQDCYDDMELEQIVDDVDDMYREQSSRSRFDLSNVAGNSFKTHDLIRRNTVAINSSNGGILSHLLNRSSQDIAEEIARSLVDKALESDRKKLVRGRYRLLGDKATQEQELIVENYIEVSMSRAMETTLNEIVDGQVNDIANIVYYGCGGDVSQLASIANKTSDNYLQLEMRSIMAYLVPESATVGTTISFGLHRSDEFKTINDDYTLNDADEELDEQMRELTNSGERWRGSRHMCNEICLQKRRERGEAAAAAEKKLLPSKQASSHQTKKEDERRKRNSLGILLSSLQKKVYHCRCVDCQEQRRVEGKPEPEVSIEVKEVEIPDVPEDVQIVIPRTKKRGRPRIFPRLEDLFLHGRGRLPDGEAQMPPPPPPPESQPQISLAAAAAVTAKRPRGRPRKYKINGDAHQGPTATVRESADGKLVLTIKNHRSPVNITRRQRIKKTKKTKGGRRRRKRGRPRKLPESEEESEEEESDETTDESDLDDDTFYGSQQLCEYGEPRKRPTRASAGKNLKRFLDMEEDDEDGEKDEDDESLFVPVKASGTDSRAQRDQDQLPVKRRPGRPRKYPPPPHMAPAPPHLLTHPTEPPGPAMTSPERQRRLTEKEKDSENSCSASFRGDCGVSKTPSGEREQADRRWLLPSRCESHLPPSSCSGFSEGSVVSPSSSVINRGRKASVCGDVLPPVPAVSQPPAVGHRRRLTRSSSSPLSSPSKRWSELHEEQLPFAMVDDEPDVDQDHLHAFHLKSDDDGSGFVIDCNGNRADRRKLEEGLSGVGEKNEIPLHRGRRSVSSEVTTMRSTCRISSSPTPQPLCIWGERSECVAKKSCAAPTPVCKGENSDFPGEMPLSGYRDILRGDSEGFQGVAESLQIGSCDAIGNGNTCSTRKVKPNCIVQNLSEVSPGEKSAGIFRAHLSGEEDSGGYDVNCSSSEAVADGNWTMCGGEDQVTLLQGRTKLMRANVPKRGCDYRAETAPDTCSYDDGCPASLTGEGKVTELMSIAGNLQECLAKENKQRGANKAVRRTFRLKSEESASKLVDRLSGIVKQLNAKLRQSRWEKDAEKVKDEEEGKRLGAVGHSEGKEPPDSGEMAMGSFSAACSETERRLQQATDRRKRIDGREAALPFSNKSPPAITKNALFPEDKDSETPLTKKMVKGDSRPSDEWEKRQKSNATNSGGGGDGSDFVLVQDRHRLPPTPYLEKREKENAKEPEEKTQGNGLRGDCSDDGREAFEMKSKLGRRGAQTRVDEEATENGRGRVGEGKTVKEGCEAETGNNGNDTDETNMSGSERRGRDKYGDDTADSCSSGTSVTKELLQPKPLVEDTLLCEKAAVTVAEVKGLLHSFKRRPPLPQEAAPNDSGYNLPGWSGIRLGSSFVFDHAFSDECCSTSNISMVATSEPVTVGDKEG